MIVCAKAKDALNITLSNGISFTNVHLCGQRDFLLYFHVHCTVIYCTVIFVISVNTCVFWRSVDNKGSYLSIYLSIYLS